MFELEDELVERGQHLPDGLDGRVARVVQACTALRVIGKPPEHWDQVMEDLHRLRRGLAPDRHAPMLDPNIYRVFPYLPANREDEPSWGEPIRRVLASITTLKGAIAAHERTLLTSGYRWDWTELEAVREKRSAGRPEHFYKALIRALVKDWPQPLRTAENRRILRPYLLPLFDVAGCDISSGGKLDNVLKALDEEKTREKRKSL